MKTNFKPSRSESGSVMFVALMMGALLILFMFYYLNLVRGQNMAVARSQAWNGAMAAAEAGVEEALAQLNPGAISQPADRSANGWGMPVNGFYGPKERTMDEQTSYSVRFSAWTPLTIVAKGSVTIPSIPVTITRVVQVVATNIPIFTTSLAARYNINMNGNSVITDSYDSSDPRFSTKGKYDPKDSSKAKKNGDVASLNGLINVGIANIGGDIFLGTNASYGISQGGSVSGNIYHDFNVDFPDVVIPDTHWLTPPAGAKVDGTTYTYGFTNPVNSGDFIIPASVKKLSIYIGAKVNVRLRINSATVDLTNIRIDGTNTLTAGSLTLYVDSNPVLISGKITVESGGATNFCFMGTSNVTSLNYSGDGAFYGTVYAPSADFILGGGGSTPTPHFYGSTISKNLSVTSPYRFHFDEAAMQGPFSRGHIVTSWRELAPNEF